MSWTPRNGAPDNINALAQTTDGWLWLGTGNGLVRFDGVSFEPLRLAPDTELPSKDVYTLMADTTGGLWIGWRLGGVSHYREGTARNWSAKDGLPEGSIWGFAADHGDLWAAGIKGLSFFDGRRWQRIGPEQGFTATKASAVSVMHDGTVAVLSDNGLFLRAPGATRFEGPLGRLDARQPLQQGPRKPGEAEPVYIVEPGGIRILDSLRGYEGHGHPWIYRQNDESTGLILLDRSGALWYDDKDGLHRNTGPRHAATSFGHRHALGTESFSTIQGLSSKHVTGMMEDRDGAVWIATKDGIDRFRDANVVRVDGPVFDWASVAPAPAEGIVATDGEKAWRLDNSQASHPLSGRENDALTVDSSGELWTASALAVRRRAPDGSATKDAIALPARASPVNKVHALARATDGSFWLSLVGGGALHYVRGKWERPAVLPDGGSKAPLSLMADRHGAMWFGYMDGGVVRIDGDRVRTFGQAEGLAIGKVALLADLDGVVMAGGEKGLARFDGKRFVPITTAPAGALDEVVSAVASPQGLWLNDASGVVQLDRRVLEGGAATPVRIFDESEGLHGRTGLLQVSTVTRARDGRIWASTTRGIFWLDPATMRREALPNRPTLLQADVDGKAYDPNRPLHLPPRPQRMALRYAAPALAMPERIRYRYRLEGYDLTWQAAGRATDAIYTGLPPGNYRFIVQAVNGAGEYGNASMPLLVHVEATLIQTVWFRIVCAFLAALVFWLTYRYRLRQQASRLLALAHMRHAERDRIARELHDTLLQSVQGLILRFDAVSAQLPQHDPLRTTLDRALERASAAVSEARERVHGLRAFALAPVDLVLLARELADEMRDEMGLNYAIHVYGTPAPVSADVADACYYIMREALRNAYAHACADLVEVRLKFVGDVLRVSIADNGKGIDAALLAAGAPGHWGIVGMRERAIEVGGKLHVDPTPGGGTTLVFIAPKLG